MERITEKMLHRKIDYLNKITGSPRETVTKSESGIKFNVGNFTLDKAYGGYALERISNEQGGVSSVFNGGHVSKRELFNRISAFINGIEFANNPDKY